MFNLERKCPVCESKMEYRPNKIWTGMRYATTMHGWVCNGNYNDVEKHSVKFNCRPTDEYLEWEKIK